MSSIGAPLQILFRTKKHAKRANQRFLFNIKYFDYSGNFSVKMSWIFIKKSMLKNEMGYRF